MNRLPIEDAQDADLRQSLVALQRSARRAREIAEMTGTALVVTREDGVIEYLKPVSRIRSALQWPSTPYE